MRCAGVLCPISSLPNRHGVGDFGKSAYEFIDFLSKDGFKLWQILPLNPIGYGHSPYQPFSSNAMDEMYISLDMLFKDGYLEIEAPDFNKDSDRVDYEGVHAYKDKYLFKAYQNAVKKDKDIIAKFEKEEPWVYNYAVFMALKHKNHMVSWDNWPDIEKNWIIDHKYDVKEIYEDIAYQIFLQMILLKQWNALHAYANMHGIKIIGDIPFYVGADSIDVWENQQYFMLKEDKTPKLIAGVPPDYFSKTGQRWGNPIYNWDVLKNNGFDFILKRIAYNAKIFDIIRLDHFRAFDTYYVIDAKYPTAEIGEWVEAPGYQFFDLLFKKYPDIEIIAEDLGDLRPEVLTLRDHYNFPGMKIVEFTFEEDELYSSIGSDVKKENMVSYISTHDNDTLIGWFNDLNSEKQDAIKLKLKELGYINKDVADNFLCYLLDLPTKYSLLSIWDILHLDKEGRMNVPGIINEINWTMRMKDFTSFNRKETFLKKIIKASKR